MGLIKSQNAPATIAAFSMQDVEQAAKNILMRARARAEQFLTAAQEEADALKAAAKVDGQKEGQAEGYAKGLEEGRKQGRDQATAARAAELTQLLGTFQKIVTEINTSRLDLEAQALTEVVQLAIAIGRRVTKRQAAIDPQVLTANLTGAMKLVVSAVDLRIALHPTQRQVFIDALPALKLTFPALEHAHLVDDSALSPGDCRVFSRSGDVFAELDGQLDRIVADLLPSPATQEPASVSAGDGA